MNPRLKKAAICLWAAVLPLGCSRQGSEGKGLGPPTEDEIRAAVKAHVAAASGYYGTKEPEIALLSAPVELDGDSFTMTGGFEGKPVAFYVSISRSATKKEKAGTYYELMVVARDNGAVRPADKGRPRVIAQFLEQ